MYPGVHRGMDGPQNTGHYNSRPWEADCSFFHNEGAWKSEYGEFFLSWYSGELAAHMNRMLGTAKTVLDEWMVGFEKKPKETGWTVAGLTNFKNLWPLSNLKSERELQDVEESSDKTAGELEKKVSGPDPKKIRKYSPLNRVSRRYL